MHSHRYSPLRFLFFFALLFLLSGCASSQSDSVPPAVNIYIPTAQGIIPPSFTVKGRAGDKSGISHVIVTATSGNLSLSFSNHCDRVIYQDRILYELASYTAPLHFPQKGKYILRATAVDPYGNSNTSHPVPVTVSTQALDTQFRFYSLPHWMGIGFIIFVTLFMVFFLRKKDNPSLNRKFAVFLGLMLLIDEAVLLVWHIGVGDFRPGINLPLHLCSIAVFFSAAILLMRERTKTRQLLYEIVYFWGLGGAIQAVLTPDIGAFGFPHFRYFSFFISHGIIIAAAIYMTVIEKYRPKFLSIWKVLLITNIYGFIMLGVNQLFRFVPPYEVGNYLFITYPPVDGSIIDVLVKIFGPSPRYLIGLEIVAVISFVVYYLPFLFIDLVKKIRSNRS